MVQCFLVLSAFLFVVVNFQVFVAIATTKSDLWSHAAMSSVHPEICLPVVEFGREPEPASRFLE